MGRSEIPSDIAQMIADFNNQELQARGCFQKTPNPKGRDLLYNNHALSINEAIVLAREEGLTVEVGGGRKHTVHLISADGKDKIPLPMHAKGRDLSTGVAKVVIRFIRKHSSRFNESET